MRRDGDRLLMHLSSATRSVRLCAPFIKVGVLESLLKEVAADVRIDVVTRWIPSEVALGVSDLEVFDLLGARPKSTLRLLDNLHAKIFVVDDSRVLAGSSNLTAPALGWSARPNVELLASIPWADKDLQACLRDIEAARTATVEERDRVREQAEALAVPELDLPASEPPEGERGIWLPMMGAPGRLYQGYAARLRERLQDEVLQAADQDLAALAIPPGLTEPAFKAAVAHALTAMPGIARILDAAADEVTDEDAVELIRRMRPDDDIDAGVRWRIVRDWLGVFLAHRYELAPQSFVLRPRSGTGRR